MRRAPIGLLLLIAGACANQTTEPDAASPVDTGIDSGVVIDTGLVDAADDAAVGEDAAPDAGSVDAMEDAGPTDADEDAGPEDTGPEDTGPPPDSGPPPDAGPRPCSTVCQVTPPAAAIPTAGLVLWLRADEGANASSPQEEVCIWCDLSGNGHDLPASGTPILLSSGTGGEATVQSGAGAVFRRDDLLTISSTAGRTFVSVYRLTNPGVRTQPITQGAAGTAGTYLSIDANTFNTSGQFYGAYVTNNAYQSTTVTSTQGEMHIYRMASMTQGLPVLTQLEYFVDGVTQTITRTAGGLGNGNIENFSNADFSRVGSSTALHEVSEVLVYDRPISEPERAQIESYLRARYSL